MGKRKAETEFAFFIEDVDDMAKRNGFKEQATGRIKPSQLDARTSSLFSIFQYMIGNLDWSSLTGTGDSDCCHNGKLIGPGENDSPYYPVPYDFDSSGLVNAHYALPSEKLRMRKITNRLFRGFCLHKQFTGESLELFRGKKDSILAMFRDEQRLPDRARDKALDYLGKFFEQIDESGTLEREFENKCRGKSK
jgi:hypothetical protein